MLVARELGASAFGSFSYALAFGLLLGTVIAWGFDAEILRRGSTDPAALDVVLGQALLLRTAHAVPVLVLGGVVGVVTRPTAEAAQTLLLVLLACVLDGYGDSGRSAATAREQPGRAAVALVAQRVSACLLAVAALAAGGGVVAVSGAYLLSSVVGQVALGVLLRRLGVRPRLRPDGPALRRTWRSTFLLGVDTVLAMALFRIDAVMLGALADDAAVAAYAVAYRLMETVLFVTWAVSRSLFPAMARAGGGPALLRVGETAVSVAGALLVPYGVLLLVDGGELLRLLFGAEYGGDSVTALRLLAFAPLVFAAAYYASYLLLVQRRNRGILVSTVVAVVLNIALNLALIPALGARGAAAATTASYLVEAVVCLAYVRPGAGWLRLDRALLLPAVAALPMAVLLVVLGGHVLVQAAVAGAAYVAGYLLLTRWRDPERLALLRAIVTRG